MPKIVKKKTATRKTKNVQKRTRKLMRGGAITVIKPTKGTDALSQKKQKPQVGVPSKWPRKPHELHPLINPGSIEGLSHHLSRLKAITNHHSNSEKKKLNSIFTNKNIMQEYRGRKLSPDRLNRIQKQSTELLEHINEIKKQYALNPKKIPYISPDLQQRIIKGINEKIQHNENTNFLTSIEGHISKKQENHRRIEEIRKEFADLEGKLQEAEPHSKEAEAYNTNMKLNYHMFPEKHGSTYAKEFQNWEEEMEHVNTSKFNQYTPKKHTLTSENKISILPPLEIELMKNRGLTVRIKGPKTAKYYNTGEKREREEAEAGEEEADD